MKEPVELLAAEALRRLEAQMLDRAYLYDHQPTYREAVRDVFAAIRKAVERPVAAA